MESGREDVDGSLEGSTRHNLAMVEVFGANWCPDCKRTKQFLQDQRIPFRSINVEEDEDGRRRVEDASDGKLIIPLVVFPDGQELIEPSNAQIAQLLGLTIQGERSFYDLVIIGGGPTGLTAGIYAAREGIATLILDRGALGGQAGATERVDNYPGFPDGVSGEELASLYVAHAKRYGVEMLQGVAVSGVARSGGELLITVDGGQSYRAKAVLIASGSTYRRLEIPGESDLIGAGVHFCATCDGPFYRGAKNLVVIGGGNSALEESLFLSQFVEHVTILEARDRLSASTLLQERIASDPKFAVHTGVKVQAFEAGDDHHLSAVVIDEGHGEERIRAAGAFVFIGLTPNSAFVRDSIELDEAGFIVTRSAMETSMPGVFAAGDVRLGSTKQIASAVGEGAAALIMIRTYLDAFETPAASA